MLDRTTSSRTTPCNDGYPTCERTYASLLIYSGEFEPDHVSRVLGLEPTKAYSAGQKMTTRPRDAQVYKLNLWELCSESSVQSRDLRRHLDWLLDHLEPATQALFELQSLSSITMRVGCFWYGAGSGGPTLWPEQMRRLAALNLEWAVSFYHKSEHPEALESRDEVQT